MLKHLRRLRPPRLVKTLSSLDAYARWAASYPPRAHNALMEAEEAAMLSLLPALEGRTVLDLACGTGRYGRLALERGAARVIGLDNSAAMLRANALPQRIEASSEAIPLAGAAVDVILCGLALGHLPRLTPSLREMGRVLRPGGVALVSDFHPFLALNGGQRTFTAPDGATYAVEHHVHLYSDTHQAASEAGLHIEHVVEPCLAIDPAPRNQAVASGRGVQWNAPTYGPARPRWLQRAIARLPGRIAEVDSEVARAPSESGFNRTSPPEPGTSVLGVESPSSVPVAIVYCFRKT